MPPKLGCWQPRIVHSRPIGAARSFPFGRRPREQNRGMAVTKEPLITTGIIVRSYAGDACSRRNRHHNVARQSKIGRIMPVSAVSYTVRYRNFCGPAHAAPGAARADLIQMVQALARPARKPVNECKQALLRESRSLQKTLPIRQDGEVSGA